MYCNKCGAYLPDDADFCPSCGMRVGRSVHAVPVQTAPVSRGKNSIIIAAIAAVAVVLVACIICFAVFTYRGQQNQLAAVQASQTDIADEGTQDDTQTSDNSDVAQQPEPSSDTADTDEEETDDAASTTVTNNYYYYGSGAARDNNYYTSSSSTGFLWPTDTQYISTSDLRGLSRDTVAAIRNEIYARHGYAFTTERWQSYFAAKTWYHRDSTCTEATIKARLSSIERANISTIVAYEESMGWRG